MFPDRECMIDTIDMTRTVIVDTLDTIDTMRRGYGVLEYLSYVRCLMTDNVQF